MEKRTINVFVLGALILALALFGCSSENVSDTTATGAAIDGAALYTSDCSGCHGPLAASGKKGASVSQIQNAIAHNWGGMGAFAGLTTDQLQAITTALAPMTTNTPATAASLDGAALYADNCSSCHGPLATSGKLGATASRIQNGISGNYGGMGSLSNLTTMQVQAIASALTTSTSTPAPPPTDGATLYSTYCGSCHGTLAASSKAGRTAAQIQTAITNNSGGMGSLSNLTTTQIQAIASALATAPTPTPTTTDGAALYGTYCASCHGPLATSTKSGATATPIQTAITNNTGGMGQLTNLTSTQIQAIATALSTSGSTTTPTTPACGSCHAIPPSTGHHTYHVNSQGLSCSTCHGTGYSSTTVNTATHDNGTVNITSTIGWNPSTRTCSNSCHGTERW